MEVWYNPACTHCVIARGALDEAGIAYESRDYLNNPPTAEELAAVLSKLGLEPRDITRFHEPLAATLGVDQDSDLSRDEWITVLVQNPRLIQRPILILDDGTAYVARDSETLQTAVARQAKA